MFLFALSNPKLFIYLTSEFKTTEENTLFYSLSILTYAQIGCDVNFIYNAHFTLKCVQFNTESMHKYT